MPSILDRLKAIDSTQYVESHAEAEDNDDFIVSHLGALLAVVDAAREMDDVITAEYGNLRDNNLDLDHPLYTVLAALRTTLLALDVESGS